MAAVRLGVSVVRHVLFRGRGLLAGRAPDPAVPDSPDGRLRKLNQPAVGRVVVFDRQSMRIIDSTRSALDGTWEISNLDAGLVCFVVGFDDTGAQNAAIQDWVKPYVPE